MTDDIVNGPRGIPAEPDRRGPIESSEPADPRDQPAPPEATPGGTQEFKPNQALVASSVTPELEAHSLANLFSRMEGEAFKALVASIREHKQQENIIMYQGKILDGRNRCRRAAAEIANSDRSAKTLSKANTVAAVERMAKADRRMAATDDQWDADPWALNTPSGVVNLGENAGAISPHSSDAYMTMCTAAPIGGRCPLWGEFLYQMMNGDEELVAFLQRMCGYGLTGSTREHALFFLYGTGGNGKSVFIDTVSGVMGDYSKTAPMETFVASHGDRHPTELAGLRGARLVCATETEEGRRWSEAKIKQITGGDKISARFMRQDFFEFKPQFKLVIAGNHKPGLRSVDEAMQRRFHLVPFTVNIPKPEQDKELGEKLKAEWPGILQWMIDGAKEWQSIGLSPPAAVVEATKAYMAEEDTTAEWLAECCSTESKNWDTTARLFESWKAHADDTGEFAGTKKRFSQKLIDRGFAQKRGGGGARGFKGIRVLSDHQRAALLKAEDG